MKLFSTCIIAFLLFTTNTFSQSITELILPRYIQGTGNFNPADDRKTPFACRLKIEGLTANKTYRYTTGFVDDPGNPSSEGHTIHIDAAGNFVRTENPDFISGYGEFTTDASGSYTGWFMAEVNHAFLFFPYPGSFVYFRVRLNDGDGGTSTVHYLTTTNQITTINFGPTPDDGTALRSTAATSGIAKNFVMLWDDATDRPVCGSVIESDGVDNTIANGYADFYTDFVNGQNKTWGVIIPNNLASGIKKIAQYNLTDGAETGVKTSADGSWAKAGGGSASTANADGGLASVIVLDGSIITLGAAVQQPQTITFVPLTAKTYGNADLDPGATASSTLPVTYTSSNLAVATIVNGNTIHIVGAGTTDITAEQAGSTDYSAAAPVVRSLTVNPAPLTITAENKEKVQGDPLPAFTIIYDGFVNGDDAGDLTTPPIASTTATASSGAGDYPITISGATATNYTITHVPGNLKVTASRQQQTIALGPLVPKTYGDADFAPATASSGLQVFYTSDNPAVATVVNNKIHIVGAGTAMIKASQPGDINYEAAVDVSELLTVKKASLIIKAENKSRLFGQPNPELTIAYTGFVNNESKTTLTTQPTISTTAIASSQPGNYPIKVEGAAAANYDITYENGTLTVNPLPAQTITFDALPVKRYGDGDFVTAATASSGLAVSYSSSNTSVATVVNGMIHITGAGTTNITASQPGNAFNAPAPDVIRTLTVQKANLEIRVADTVKMEGQRNPDLEIKYNGFVNGENVSNLITPAVVSTTATTNSVAGKYPILVTGATSNNYAIAQLSATLRILPPQGSSEDNINAYLSSPGQLKVNIYSVEAGKAGIQLFDQHGTRLLQVNVTLVKGHSSYQLPVGNVVPGIYHVRVSGPAFLLKTKVVIR
ncbi:hypothetical protein D3H65_10525 [Paraflavitalea soli]|uniref:MBG domain-containing protein n=1 Tax=Paraflavitalea soli TaxID=2315862 RepID=A0A3B7MRZ2_9BACT|nr:MBG domain-containing protein [Paraflavitalea soli]AXY74385.1 hypothetical protein D3H65_10525 [Paraflavitalea soli]